MKIIVYSTDSCPYCHELKNFLDENKVEYTNVDVSNDEDKVREMVKKSGQMGVPVTDIDGEIILGFDKENIKNKLNLK